MKRFYAVIATVLTLIGLLSISTASAVFTYQPKTPKSLQK